ncbi:hypothetical protein Tco_1318738 [Tanacetum coccineum]
MRMEQYLTNTDYALWQVIMNGDEPVQTTKDENGVETEDAKTLWAAIKSRFGGNVESKKMQKNVLKQQFENFSNNVALIMRNKTGIDDLDIDDLYNNLKVFEADIKGSSRSSSNSQNVAFLSAEDTNNINEVNTANGVSTASCHNSHGQDSSSTYTDDLMFSFFANQSNSPQLDDEDLEQIDHDDLEEMDLIWECKATRNQGNRNGDAGYRSRDNTRRTVPVETFDALVVQDNALIVQDGLGYDWSYIAQDEPTEFALMAYTSGSNTELGLEFVEAQLVVHQKNEVIYEEKITVLEFEVKDKGNVVTRLTNQLEQTLKEKEDLKAKLEYRSSDGDDNQINHRFKKDNGYHVVPPPLTRNYMPPLADLSFAGLDDSVYRPTTNKTSASVSQVETSITPPSNTSVKMPRVESVRPSRVIIEYWVSDDDEDIFQSNDVQTTVNPSFKKIEFTKARNEPVKSDKQAVKPRMVTQSPKGKGTGHREVRPIWNNTQRINHQNKCVPTAVLTRSGRIPVSTAKQVSKEKVNTVRVNGINIVGQTAVSTVKGNRGNPQQALKYKGMFDSGCSKHMTGNKALLTDYQDIDGGFVSFSGSTRGGKITGIGKIRTNKIDFEDVFFVKELKFNLFSVS